ncbi:MAG: NnrS family protein [Nitrospiraceae bacterium]
MALVALGGSLLGVGLQPADALHMLTAGSVGTMTLGVMTRASLGHTGRPKTVGPMTIAIYSLVMLGALLRVVVPSPSAPTAATHLVLALASLGWSGAYLLFALVYGPYLCRPSLDD